MSKKIGLFLAMGLVWLFLFSLPMGKGRSVYQVLHHYIVDTKPVLWVAEKISSAYDSTVSSAGNTSESVTKQGRDSIAQSSDALRGLE
jgi:hypothetical protein